ncbi:hypothetical protein V6N12_044532 [Hibiscus sabdariffa]|uniref:Uncharacterized protein n=1 Tax=Hibiscus sabdariffa TaxID=183260 RepID=A0ABR2BNI9_9ROSI
MSEVNANNVKILNTCLVGWTDQPRKLLEIAIDLKNDGLKGFSVTYLETQRDNLDRLASRGAVFLGTIAPESTEINAPVVWKDNHLWLVSCRLDLGEE